MRRTPLHREKLSLNPKYLPVLLLLPALFMLGVFNYYPIFQTFIYSFFDLDHTSDWLNSQFIGFQNYLRVFGSRSFWSAATFTLGFTVSSVFFDFWIGMLLALATFWVRPGFRGILRAMIIVPWAIPQVIQASMWKWMFNSDVGMIGDIMVRLGLVESSPLFLANTYLAIMSVVVVFVWRGSSMSALFLMGGLAMVPLELYEAARLDGAGTLRRFWSITFPVIMPTIFVDLLYRTQDALRVFDIIYGLTGGGPGTATESLSSFAYKHYFGFVNFGTGSAYAMFTFALIVTIGVFYIRKVHAVFEFKE